MEHYPIYLFIFLGLLIGTRILTNRQFYKLSDEDKLKLINLNKSVATMSYIFYGALMALYVAAIYAFDVNAIMATRALIICFSVYLIIFSIRSFRRLRAENIVIPHYTALLVVRLVIYAVFFGGVFMYLNSSAKSEVSDEAYNALDEAWQKYAKGDNRSAVQICDALIKKDSTVSVYYVNRGVYRYNAGDDAGAYQDWQRALGMGDTTALKYMHSDRRKAAEYMEKARKKWEEGDYKSAAALCDTLIEKDSTVSVYYINRGVYKHDAGDHAGANRDWEHSLTTGDTTALKYIRANN